MKDCLNPGPGPDTKNAANPDTLTNNYKGKSLFSLSQLRMFINFYFKNKITGEEGMMVSFLDLETESRETLKVIVNGKQKYWNPQDVEFIRAEKK
jgi:hypothetical protein